MLPPHSLLLTCQSENALFDTPINSFTHLLLPQALAWSLLLQLVYRKYVERDKAFVLYTSRAKLGWLVL